jgi:hypothetical protein
MMLSSRGGDPPDPPAPPAGGKIGARGRGRALVAALLLAAGLIVWAALPVAGARPGIRLALTIAVICAAASIGRLAIGDARIGGSPFDPVPVRLAAWVADQLRTLPWTEAMLVAALAAEALHRPRPWHTAVLGAALLAYLLAARLAETTLPASALAPQLPVLAAGLGLLALAAGAAALPRLAPGPGAELLRVLAIVAAVIAGGLALPVAARGGRGGRSGRSERGGGR